MLNALAANHVWWPGREVNPQRLTEVGLDPGDLAVKQLMELTGQLMGFPRHMSQHPGGFVLTRGPLTRMVPVENASMEDRTIIQWDKDDIDALGLLKVDVPALGMLSAIRRALEFVSLRKGYVFEMQDIPAEDATTYDMICKADTVGVFQIESRAQMAMLPRLRLRCFYDLVIEVALVRPGPIQGGSVHPYLERRQGRAEVIIWKSLREKQRPEVLRSRLLAVYGVWQREGDVMSLIAGQLQDLSPLLGELSTTSRDFH